MDEKLAEHRAKKQRQEKFNQYKNLFLNMITFTSQSESKKNDDTNDSDHINVSRRTRLAI